MIFIQKLVGRAMVIRCVGISLAILLCVCPYAESKDCKKVDQCKCTFDDNSGTVDMTPLGSTGGPWVQDVFGPDNYAYSFNPCYPFTEGTCVNAAACQVDTANVVYYNIGDSSNVDFAFDGNNVIVTYVSDDQARSSKVTLVCDPNTSPSVVTVQGETGTAIYSFTVTGKDVCPTGGSDVPVGPSGPTSVTASVSISVGSILTITFFSILVVYFIAGAVFMKFVRNNSGREIVPNSSLWVAIPGLIKDGFGFVIGSVKRKTGYGAI